MLDPSWARGLRCLEIQQPDARGRQRCTPFQTFVAVSREPCPNEVSYEEGLEACLEITEHQCIEENQEPANWFRTEESRF